MIGRAMRTLRQAGVLGINNRNAEYIMRCNPRKAYPFADNKILTRRLAQKHGIPTPALYRVVENHSAIGKLPALLEEKCCFVVKPARGSGGSGILLITGRAAGQFVDQNGAPVTWADLSHHISNILSGIHSLSGLDDQALIEELVYPDKVFAPVTFVGVPDIRIVVYQGIPAMAMLRLPTLASGGKANLHRGAIGAGIDIGTGTTLTAVADARVIDRHPDTGQPVRGIRIPYWEEMLLTAATMGGIAGLGYIGVDILIDRNRGPLLLEINARPGLSIQIANLCGLKNRLNRIDSAPAKISAPLETRVHWAMETFTASY